jgi:replication factor C small subunit
MVGQQDIVKRVKSLVNAMNIPHLLFAGPAGIGKSTLALIVVKELFKDKWKENYLELNASDERGIDVVRQKVKDFARTKALGNVPFKVIFLDEADALTREAQQALRRTMENYTNTCRFIMSCNYSSKILDPIQSRCVVFRFKLLEKKDVAEVIRKISTKENIQIDEEGISAIYEMGEGDCRRAINLLQATSAISLNIDKEMVNLVSSSAKPADIKVVLDYALAGDFINAKEKLLDVMLKESISGTDVVKAIQKEVWNLPIEAETKVRITEKTGEIEFRIVEGSDEFVQLESLLASFVLAGQKEKI